MRRVAFPSADDRGSSLVELVVAMLLTALAAGSIVGLVAGSANTVERVSDDDPLVAVAADWLVRDLREATALDVVAHDGAAAVTLDVTTPAGVVRWGSAGGTVERQAPAALGAQPVVGGLHPVAALKVALETTAGFAIDPADAVVVAECARLLVVTLIAADGSVVHERVVGLRELLEEPDSC